VKICHLCCSSRTDKTQGPEAEEYDPYEYDDEGIDVGNELFYLILMNTGFDCRTTSNILLSAVTFFHVIVIKFKDCGCGFKIGTIHFSCGCVM